MGDRHKRRRLAKNAIQDVLSSHKVSELPSGRDEIISLKTSDTLSHAVSVLRENGIHSCPVFDEESEDSFCGFLDVSDIANYLVVYSPDPHTLARSRMGNFVWAGTDYGGVSVKSVLELFRRFGVPSYPDDSLLTLCEIFEDAHTAHTIVLESRSNLVPTKVLSQFDVVNFLAKNLPDSVKAYKFEDMKPRPERIHLVYSDASVLVALQKLAIPEVGALAVVSDEGQIIGNFSVSDLEGLFEYSEYVKITAKVSDFLKHHTPKSLEPITCNEQATIQDYLDLMVRSRVHHVWTVDSNQCPVNVCSTSDIIAIARRWNQSDVGAGDGKPKEPELSPK